MERIVKSLAMAQALQMGQVQWSRQRDYRNNSAVSCSSSPSPFNVTNTRLTQNIKSEALSSLNNMQSSKSNRNFFYTGAYNDSMTQLGHHKNGGQRQGRILTGSTVFLHPVKVPDKTSKVIVDNQNYDNRARKGKHKYSSHNQRQQQVYDGAGQQHLDGPVATHQTQQESAVTEPGLQIDSIHSGSIDLYHHQVYQQRTGESPGKQDESRNVPGGQVIRYGNASVYPQIVHGLAGK